jgi:DNA end-binding protein Ku
MLHSPLPSAPREQVALRPTPTLDKGMVGIGSVVLSKRERPIMIEAFGKGMRGMTLRYPYEVRDEKGYFDEIEDVKVSGETLKLAEHIIEKKADDFDPKEFVDHYEVALVEMLKKKQAGQPVTRGAPSRPSNQNVINIMDLLRRSVDETKKPTKQSPSIAPAMPKGKAKTRAKAL